MPFRDDHDAAIQRADALERELDVLEREHTALASGRRKPVDWRQLAPVLAGTAVTTTFTALALTLGWGTWWAAGGALMVLLSLLALVGSSGADMPQGAVPVRASFEVAGPDGARPVVITAVVRLPTSIDEAATVTTAQASFTGQTLTQVAAVAAVAIETAVRATSAKLPKPLDSVALTALVEPAAREHLGRLGLILAPGALWVATS